jgi:hypothetical protein
MAFMHDDGRLTPVPCHCPNRCRWCSWRVALENALVVKTDAEMQLPEIGFTLTTRAATTAPKTFRRDVEQTFKALRRQPWARDARYLGQIEFTTGSGARSGGSRRIHQHGLLKDVARDRAADVGELMRRLWLPRTGAHRVEAHELHRPAGAIAYLVNHHQKQAQTPPRGWSGKRLRPSKGYYERPIAQLREQARAVLAQKAAERTVERWLEKVNAWDVLGGTEDYFELRDSQITATVAARPVLVWTQRVPTAFGEDGLPATWVTEVVGTVHEGQEAA